MENPNRLVTDLFGTLKSWLPWQAGPVNISRDFWMPDHSCRVCYECDCEFTIFNRRHHCRLCGRIFCGKCTANNIPVPCDDLQNIREERERVRVCNFCFKQWEQRTATYVDHGVGDCEINSSNSSSAGSFVSSGASEAAFCSTVSLLPRPYQFGHCDELSEISSLSLYKPAAMDLCGDLGQVGDSRSSHSGADIEDPSGNQLELKAYRTEYEDDNFSAYQFDPKHRAPSWNNCYSSSTAIEDLQYACNSHSVCSEGDCDRKSICGSTVKNSYVSGQNSFPVETETEKENYHDIGYECKAPSSASAAENIETQPIDFDNNGLLWFPPEPDNEEDDRDAVSLDDNELEDTEGEWGSHSSGSFGSGDYGCKAKSVDDQKKAVKFVVDRHFRALVSQLLQVENLAVDVDDAGESWLEIVTSLSWEAATVLKPDTSRGGGMDPGGYVKVKCIASGHRSQSTLLRGVVCKKNVAHRRMTTKVVKPRVMILGGALEYQRVSNLLSSVDTLLKQEMDHLKMAVTKIDAHNPDVLLVERSVSRFAQDYILEKNIALVLNIKRPLLERIARCTGAQIVPSIDHLSSQMLGNCDSFYVEKHLETHGSAGQGGRRLTKTLMYFEGCPKPLGCTILLRGANGDELKKVKQVVKYGIFAAYHLALETSFLADEGASLPEVSVKEPVTVALPNELLSMNRSISIVPGLTNSHSDGSFRRVSDHRSFNGDFTSTCTFPSESSSLQNTALKKTLSVPVEGFFQHMKSTTTVLEPVLKQLISDEHIAKDSLIATLSTIEYTEDTSKEKDSFLSLAADGCLPPEAQDNAPTAIHASIPSEAVVFSQQPSTEKNGNLFQGVPVTSKEDFLHASSDNQRIVVSLSSRCVWKGTVCERSHLFRIKYYGSSDKPLGRFLQDHLFDQSFRCRSCEMPSEAHVHCYTHRQGTLTISVKQLSEYILPGEREGKIWMWHRCLRCPRTNGFPPATRRVVMSDAAWGLSFGKFLELSFSNHAAASRVASCGHSLHRDCIRFYGSANMVACFRYASIDVHSVYLPPSKLDFSYRIQDWIQKEAAEIVDRAEVLFSGVLSALRQIAAKKSGGGSVRLGSEIPECRIHIAELEDMLHNEKAEFEDSLSKCLKRDVKEGQPVIDVLEMNRLRRQLLFQSYMWDLRLVYASSLDENSSPSFEQKSEESEVKTLKKAKELMNRNLRRPIRPIVNGGDPRPPLYLGRPSGGDKQEANPNGNSSSNQPFKGRRDSFDLTHIRGNYGSISSHEQELNSMEVGTLVRRTLSDSQFSFLTNLSDTLDAAWIGERQHSPGIPKENNLLLSGAGSVDSSLAAVTAKWGLDNQGIEHHSGDGLQVISSLSSVFSAKSKHSDSVEDNVSWLGMPFINFYRSLNKNFLESTQKLDTISGYNPVYMSLFRDLELHTGAQLFLPVGIDETVIPVYDDEPTSIISYALVSHDYHLQLSDEGYRPKDIIESALSLPLPDASPLQTFHSTDETFLRSTGSIDDSMLSLSGSSAADPVVHPKSLHVRVSFSGNGPNDKVKYTVTCYYAKHFMALRKICFPCEIDFVKSLSRCKKWGAQGGKSNVYFAKTLDDRFIIKQVTKTELESFIKFAPGYFKYLTEAIGNKSPTALAKVLGIYQVVTKHFKGGKDSKMDVLVMENLLFGRKVRRLYDLKGSSRCRYNPDVSGSNKVLLDQNLIEAMPTSPIFVGNKAKRLLERAVWNDTSFLASVDVMDYSLLVGVDEEKHELVLGIIDFMRQYTWDKHLETWVKASGILGGPKNASPTVISPKQYKIRFRKAMTTYFLIIPDQWSPVTYPRLSNTKFCEEDSPVGIYPSLSSINLHEEDSPVVPKILHQSGSTAEDQHITIS